jgi:hypothetical protein
MMLIRTNMRMEYWWWCLNSKTTLIIVFFLRICLHMHFIKKNQSLKIHK